MITTMLYSVFSFSLIAYTPVVNASKEGVILLNRDMTKN